MSVSPAPQLEGYATASDVADLFDKYSQSGFDDTTNPTKSEVERRSRIESDWVDRYTGHAWRPRQVQNEYITLGDQYYWRAGTPMKLMKRQIITPLDASEGDKIEIWDGTGTANDNGYEDWVSKSTYEEGRTGDYWIEEPTGMLYLYRRKIWFERHKEIRVTYRYGREWPDASTNDSNLPDEDYVRQNVPQAIRDAVARRVAAYYMESQQYRVTTPGNEEAPDPAQAAETWREDTKMTLEPYKEVKTLGNQ